MALSNTQDIIDDIRQGKMVILMDDEDRENEGDIILAADFVTPEAINFMAKYGRGLICLTLTRDRCEQLNLPLMTKANGAQFGTAFTLSIEAATGVTTGISAADRARTVQAAVAPDAKPADIVQPGHIFPIMAQPGGVLVRAGHTEAGCDLTRLAGLTPAAVIVEILNEDGTMARRPQLEVFAAEHGIKIGTIADLIEYRSLNEKTVERVIGCLATSDTRSAALPYPAHRGWMSAQSKKPLASPFIELRKFFATVSALAFPAPSATSQRAPGLCFLLVERVTAPSTCKSWGCMILVVALGICRAGVIPCPINAPLIALALISSPVSS